MNETLHPAGRYRAHLTKSQLTEAKSGTPQIAFTVALAAHLLNGQEKPCSGDKIIFRAITENTIDFVLEDLAKIGYPYATFDQLDCDHAQYWAPTNVEIEVSCKHETYEGKTREKWGLAGGGFQAKPVARNKIGQLNAKFGAALKQNGSTKTPPKAAPKPSAVTHPEGPAEDLEEII